MTSRCSQSAPAASTRWDSAEREERSQASTEGERSARRGLLLLLLLLAEEELIFFSPSEDPEGNCLDFFAKCGDTPLSFFQAQFQGPAAAARECEERK